MRAGHHVPLESNGCALSLRNDNVGAGNGRSNYLSVHLEKQTLHGPSVIDWQNSI